MVLELLVSIGYEALRYGWVLTTFLMPFYLLAVASESYLNDNLSLQGFLNGVERNAPVFVFGVFAAGFAVSLFSPEIQPVFENLTQPVSFLVLAFLFHRF